MRTTIFTILFSVILSGLIGAPALEAAWTGWPPETSYCGNAFDVSSFLCTATSTYEKGQPIGFTLYLFQTWPIVTGPVTIPWKIVDDQGKLVYAPATPPSIEASVGRFSWSYTWDQTDNDGKQVHKGTYSMVIPPMPHLFVVVPLTITVTNKHETKSANRE